MSDSAAPRAVDSTRRGGPGPLALDLYASGWLEPGDVEIMPVGAEPDEWQDAVRLVSTDSPSVPGSRRVLIVVLGDRRLVTIELKAARGDDSHLDGPGVAVHLVERDATGDGWTARVVSSGDVGLLRANSSWSWASGRLEIRVNSIRSVGESLATEVWVRRLADA